MNLPNPESKSADIGGTTRRRFLRLLPLAALLPSACVHARPDDRDRDRHSPPPRRDPPPPPRREPPPPPPRHDGPHARHPAPPPRHEPPRHRGPLEIFDAAVFLKDNAAISYRFLRPENPAPRAKYPVVLFLHGVGERGSDNAIQVRNGIERLALPHMRAAFPCYAIVPQCPVSSFWGLSPEHPPHRHLGPHHKPDALNLALALVDDTLRKYPNADPHRVYVIGLSMGGMATFRALEARPNFFAAAIPICGDGNAALAKHYARTPVWIFHGERDTTVRPGGSIRIEAALRQAGGRPKLSILPGVAHAAWEPALNDTKTWEWLFAQHRH
ncbi:MAG: prolyl oligopeptidase family serine peptidase [Puniceicoccales bacterium]|jgi:predicted peptidase|nr:prolyl oligopeptidase family serine peptidase [Puniceicoccales bacterium]